MLKFLEMLLTLEASLTCRGGVHIESLPVIMASKIRLILSGC